MTSQGLVEVEMSRIHREEVEQLQAEVKRLRAIKTAAERVVEQTTPEAAYRLHDGLIEALEATEAGGE